METQMINHPNRSHSVQDKLVMALGLALDEIHNPGANSAAGIDVIAICEGVLKQATKGAPISSFVRGELETRRRLLDGREDFPF